MSSETKTKNKEQPPKLSVKTLLSPISGLSKALESHQDSLIAKGFLGHGVSITVQGSRVVAPCKAKVISIAPTGHHITLGAADGLTIEIIIGFDAIKMHGVGFIKKVKCGDTVESGSTLVELDLLKLKSSLDGTDLALLISKGALKLTPYHGNMRAGEDDVMQLIIKSG